MCRRCVPGPLFGPGDEATYRIAGNIGGNLNLAVWRSGKRPPNLNPSNFARAHIICELGGPTAKFKSANFFVWAAQDQTAKFKDRQYFRLYGNWHSLPSVQNIYMYNLLARMPTYQDLPFFCGYRQ